MDAPSQLDALLALFERFDIAVRREHLGGQGGGLVRLRGKPVVFIDLDTDTATQLDHCADAAARMPEMANVHLPPILREMLETRRMK